MKRMNGILNKKNTISTNLLSYFVRSAVFFLLVTFLNILFYTVTFVQYEKENDQLFRLNDFYLQLKEMHHTMYTYSFSGDEHDFQQLQNHAHTLSDELSEIALHPVSASFDRDLLDITQIFQNYCQTFEQIHTIFQNPDRFDSVRKIYQNGDAMYQMINSEFQNLYSQILTASRIKTEQMQKREQFYLVFLVVTVILILIYEIYQARHLAERISRPILALTERASVIESQGLESASEISLPFSLNEETDRLVHIFNSMLAKIQQQMADLENYMNTKIQLKQQALENVKMSEQLKSSQLKMLQMQINPHFLFNTLNMISQTAYIENAYQTIFLLGKTASLLRYSLDFSDKSVTLEKELEELGNYVYIQEQRFGNRIRFFFELDEKCSRIPVPNLILQPLVENAIIHGLSMYTENGIIRISTVIDEPSHTVRICIADNGIGMEPSRVQKVDREMRNVKTPSCKIGLGNVYYRLQYFFNQQADLLISSIPHHSTEFTIVLPLPDNLPL